MGFFSKSKNKEELVLVFDIGSSSVGAVIFRSVNNGNPIIIFSVVEYFVSKEKIISEELFQLVLKALKVVATKASLTSFGAPSRVFCVLSAPWYASQSRTIKFEKSSPFIFTKEIYDSLIEKETKLFEKENGFNHSKSSELNNLKIIEIKNMITRLNGYDIPNPINKYTSEVEMSIFLSMSEDSILDGLRSCIARHFNEIKVFFVSFSMASFIVTRSLFVNQDNFLLINIGGEITEISMIKKNILFESGTFPLGHNFVLRSLSKILNISFEEAETSISMEMSKHNEQATSKITSDVLIGIQNEWLQSFQSIVSKISNDISIPSTIFITVDQKYSNFFANTIKVEQFNQYTMTESKFRVIFLDTKSLHGITSFENDVSRDVPHIIETIYLNSFNV